MQYFNPKFVNTLRPLRRFAIARMQLKIRTLFLLLLTQLTLHAQKQYGFEWIRPYQQYYKLKIAADGVYRLDSATLAQSGINLTGLNPSRFQLFRKGIEVPMYIHGQADGVLNARDLIEFYAQKNDGTLDRQLYQSPGFQPHPWRSMITDTAVYFFTILPDTTVLQGKRFALNTDTDFSSWTAEPYLMQEVKVFPSESYADGPDLASFEEKYTSSEYLDGEGMASRTVGLGSDSSLFYTLPTPFQQLAGTPPVPSVDIKVIPQSNAAATGNNHHVQLSINPDNTGFQLIRDLRFTGYAVQQFTQALSPSQLGAQTAFRMSIINDMALAADNDALSYIRLTYARQYDLGGQTTLAFPVGHVLHDTKSFVDFAHYGNGTLTNPVFFDLTAGERIRGQYVGGNARALVHNMGQISNLVLVDSLLMMNAGRLEPVQFPDINPADGYEFLIVTHPLLNNAAVQYAQYRSQRYEVKMVYSNQLYDYYTYGDMHPLAVRRFAEHLVTEATLKPKFMLLAGRGYETRLVSTDVNIYYGANLVPAIGVPASDVMFSNGIVGTGFEPDIATGRIAAETDDDLRHYLEKLKFYETDPDSILEWRKHMLHISGGNVLGDQQLFSSYLAAKKQLIEGKSFGATVQSYNKSVSDPVTSDLKEKLLKVQNDGISLLTFLGHGSLTVLDVDIGSVDELNNLHKYPLYYFNGCNIGNPSSEDPGVIGRIYGRRYICAQDKGAIGWLAHSNITVPGTLNAQMQKFYQHLGITSYGKPIGYICQQVSKEFGGSDLITKTHSLQWVLQADPATVIYSPSLPDFRIDSTSIYLTPGNVTALSDSFAVAVIVTNLARATDDTLEITVTRTLQNNAKVTYPAVRTTGTVYYKDTVLVWIRSKDPSTFGQNIFEVTVDKLNKIPELNKLNNTARIEFFMPGTGIQNLFPINYSIVNTDSVKLVAQNNNLFIHGSQYEFQLDTTATFNSPFLKSSGILTTDALASWPVLLPQTDTLVYFWRSRLNVPVSQGGTWNTSSFTYINQGANGWAQSKFDQYKNASDYNLLQFNEQVKQIEFSENARTISVVNRRWSHSNMGNFDPYNMNPRTGPCPDGQCCNLANGIVVNIFHAKSLDPIQSPRYPFNCPWVAQRNVQVGDVWYYVFNTTLQSDRDEFRRFIDSLDDGTYVAIWPRYDGDVRNWDALTKQYLGKIGSQKVGNIQSEYTTFVLIGRKGWTPGQAIEDTLYNPDFAGQPIPNNNDHDTLSISYEMQGKWFTGSMKSEKIGPARQWGKLYYRFYSLENSVRDHHQVSVLGVRKDGTEDVLYAQASDGLDLSGINPVTYPALKLGLLFTDSLSHTPDQFGKWMVTYQGVPEGTINPSIAYDFYKDQLQQGDSLRFRIAFQNLTNYAFDSVPVDVKITDADRGVRYTGAAVYAPLPANGSTVIEQKIPTLQLKGSNTLQLTVNGNFRTPEILLSNNIWAKDFTVNVDETNPVLDVTFDGYRIMNGDYVSPTPVIRITSKDDNAFRLQSDTSTFALSLRRPGSNSFEQISMQSGQVSFTPASGKDNQAVVEYAPERLADGLYTLQVNSRDASGNISGSNAYTIDFNVIGASMITSFFPYPNPCTTNMRFVFTLTGDKAPDDLLVRIMTVSGKIVREVSKEEFGHIHIGNNISEWAWDGTDLYGDRLANGVYLYQVLTRINGQAIDRLTTKADKYLVQNTGKIYLMK